MGKKEEELTDLKVYIKPEDNGAHYVINGDIYRFPRIMIRIQDALNYPERKGSDGVDRDYLRCLSLLRDTPGERSVRGSYRNRETVLITSGFPGNRKTSVFPELRSFS